MERDSINALLAGFSVEIGTEHSPERFGSRLPYVEPGKRTMGVTGMAARAAPLICLMNRTRAVVCLPGGGLWIPGLFGLDHARQKFTCIDKLVQVGGYPICIRQTSLFASNGAITSGVGAKTCEKELTFSPLHSTSFRDAPADVLPPYVDSTNDMYRHVVVFCPANGGCSTAARASIEREGCD